MEYPRTTKDDIEDGELISIISKVVHSQAFDDGNELYHLQDANGNELTLKIWSGETDKYDIETETWYMINDAEGDVFQGERNLGSNRGKMEVVALDEAPEFVDVQVEEEFGELVEGGILALDIETISTVSEQEIDLNNSDHVELLCIGVGFAPEVGAPGSSSVLFRQGSEIADEVDLLQRFCDYVENYSPEQLLLFKGDFDIQHLRGRAERVDSGSGISDRVSDLFDQHRIINLDPPGSLEDNAEVGETYWDIYKHSLNPSQWREGHPRYRGDVDDPAVTNKDIPYFGERYLELSDETNRSREYRALHELLRHYTVADIEPLFKMV
ncbi:hypothetical protein ABSL23_01445 [Halobacterium sp. NMX12-1]|uniref:Uncharacterized protein n=1 Tax=Halobacterium sp. NMX12-1 TaxID=3166650 RepID=A0AAU8CD89_9EURY